MNLISNTDALCLKQKKTIKIPKLKALTEF